jgi:catechol 2,3-dioxygenase-like lactoylglutathione lyase family enzyme
MIVGIHATKLVVRDVGAAESFYRTVGLKLVQRNLGGEGEVRQRQSWMSVTGDSTSHMLILSEFLEVAAPPLPAYPREFWLAFKVVDVDSILAAVERAGGSVIRVGEDRPEHGVRAAVVADPEGHVIEIVGPIR